MNRRAALAARSSLLSKVSMPLLTITQDYGSVLVGVGLTRALTFIASIMLAHALSIGGFGAYSLAYTVTTLVAQLPNMLDASFVRNYAIETDPARRDDLVRAHVYIKAAVLAMMSALALALARPLSTAIFHKPGITDLIVSALLAGACFSTFNTALAYYQAQRRFIAYSATFLCVNLGAFSALSAYVGLSAPTALGAMLVFNTFPYAIAAGLALLWLLQRSAAATQPGGQASRLLRFSGWLVPAGPIYILLQRVDVIVLSRYASYKVLGLYGAAVVLSSVVSLFTSNLQVVFLPKASESISDPKRLHDYLFQSAAVSSAVAALAVVGILLSPLLLRAGFGPRYGAAALPLRLLFLGYGLVAATPPLTALLYAAGRTRAILGERVVELVVAVALCFLLVPRFASTGAAAAITTAYAVGVIYVGFNVRRALSAPNLAREA